MRSYYRCLSKVVLLLYLNVGTQVISLPLDSKSLDHHQHQHLHHQPAAPTESRITLSPYTNQLLQKNVNAYVTKILTKRNDTIDNERRHQMITVFLIEVLKNIQNVVSKESKQKIHKYLIENYGNDANENSKYMYSRARRQLDAVLDDLMNVDLRRTKRQDIDDDEMNSSNVSDGTGEVLNEDQPPSGIAGLIATLSGGDEGSDVGALVGAVSTLISNLLGPGGLDIPSLLSTGTSLIAGLLGGDQNFGKVLAGYIGTTLDGLSGGGGADNNGLFIGNFAGALFAALSADPDEDSEEEGMLPPKPALFLQSLFKGFHAGVGKDRSGDGNDSMGHPADRPQAQRQHQVRPPVTSMDHHRIPK